MESKYVTNNAQYRSPGSGKLTDLGRKTVTQLARTIPTRQEALSQGVLKKSEDGTLVAGGAGYNTIVNDRLQSISEIYGFKNFQSIPDAFVKWNPDLSFLSKLSGYNQKKQNEIDIVRATSERSQRQTRAINQAVLSGRKNPRGSSVSLPKAALAGLGQLSRRLL